MKKNNKHNNIANIQLLAHTIHYSKSKQNLKKEYRLILILVITILILLIIGYIFFI